MKSMEVKLYQIYWKDEQKSKMFDFATPYKNETLTPYFENSVIKEIVEGIGADVDENSKIAICSWKLRDKIAVNVPPYRDLSAELLQSEYDVLSFSKNSGVHNMIQAAEVWHPGFRTILNLLWAKLGRSAVREVKNPIYQNHFAATLSIYRRYVSEVLSPSIELMESDEEIKNLVWKDSQYYKLRDNKEFRDRVKEFIGTDYCPLHAFVCERLFPLWLNDQNLNLQYI